MNVYRFDINKNNDNNFNKKTTCPVLKIKHYIKLILLQNHQTKRYAQRIVQRLIKQRFNPQFNEILLHQTDLAFDKGLESQRLLRQQFKHLC